MNAHHLPTENQVASWAKVASDKSDADSWKARRSKARKLRIQARKEKAAAKAERNAAKLRFVMETHRMGGRVILSKDPEPTFRESWANFVDEIRSIFDDYFEAREAQSLEPPAELKHELSPAKIIETEVHPTPPLRNPASSSVKKMRDMWEHTPQSIPHAEVVKPEPNLAQTGSKVASHFAEDILSSHKEEKAGRPVLDGAEIAFIAKAFENTAQETDFRFVRWSATKNQVRQSEIGTSPIWFEDENVISYETTFNSNQTIVSFHFDSGRLVEAVYGFQCLPDASTTFYRLKEFYQILWGKPVESSELWSNDSNRTLDMNNALKQGTLQLFSFWKTPRSKIGITCWANEKQGVILSIRHQAAIVANN